MISLKFFEEKNSKISLNNYKYQKEDTAKEINFIYGLNDLENNKKEDLDKNLSNIDEIPNDFNKNLETFSFMDENEKNDNSTFFEIENYDKDKINILEQSKNITKSLFCPFYKKIPINQIRKIIEKDNIIYKRNYYIEYSPLKITEYEISSIYLSPKNENDSSNCGLCNEVTNIDIKNSYSEKKYITFDKFKEVFFKLPYLSDLIRVSLSYLNGNNSPSNKQFDNFKIKVGFENNTLGIFYYPARNIGEDENNEIGDNVIKHDMNYKVKITDTVDKLIDDIKKEVLGLNIINNNQEKIIVNSLNAFDKIKCNIFYYISEENKGSKGILMEENIGYFDSLDSCMNLKNKNTAEIHITFDDDIMFINSSMNIVEKEDGYCKIYYSTNNEFAWK